MIDEYNHYQKYVNPFILLTSEYQINGQKIAEEKNLNGDRNIIRHLNDLKFVEQVETELFTNMKHKRSSYNTLTMLYELRLNNKEIYDNTHIYIFKFIDPKIMIKGDKLSQIWKKITSEMEPYNVTNKFLTHVDGYNDGFNMKDMIDDINISIDNICNSDDRRGKEIYYIISNRKTVRFVNITSDRLKQDDYTRSIHAMQTLKESNIKENMISEGTKETLRNIFKIIIDDVNRIDIENHRVISGGITERNRARRDISKTKFNLSQAARDGVTIEVICDSICGIIEDNLHLSNQLSDLEISIAEYLLKYIAPVSVEKGKIEYFISRLVNVPKTKHMRYDIITINQTYIENVLKRISVYEQKKKTRNAWDVFKEYMVLFPGVKNEIVFFDDFSKYEQSRFDTLNIYTPDWYKPPIDINKEFNDVYSLGIFDFVNHDYLDDDKSKQYENDLLETFKDIYCIPNEWNIGHIREAILSMDYHLKYVLCANNAYAHTYLVNYILHIILHDIVTGKSIHFTGENACGKSSFWTSLLATFGNINPDGSSSMGIEGDIRRMKARFNSFLHNKKLVILDEYTPITDEDIRQYIKFLLTTKYINIERKGKEIKQVDNYCNVITLGNYNGTVHTTDGDGERRNIYYNLNIISRNTEMKDFYFGHVVGYFEELMVLFVDYLYFTQYKKDFNFNNEPFVDNKKSKKSKTFLKMNKVQKLLINDMLEGTNCSKLTPQHFMNNDMNENDYVFDRYMFYLNDTYYINNINDCKSMAPNMRIHDNDKYNGRWNKMIPVDNDVIKAVYGETEEYISHLTLIQDYNQILPSKGTPYFTEHYDMQKRFIIFEDYLTIYLPLAYLYIPFNFQGYNIFYYFGVFTLDEHYKNYLINHSHKGYIGSYYSVGGVQAYVNSRNNPVQNTTKIPFLNYDILNVFFKYYKNVSNNEEKFMDIDAINEINFLDFIKNNCLMNDKYLTTDPYNKNINKEILDIIIRKVYDSNSLVYFNDVDKDKKIKEEEDKIKELFKYNFFEQNTIRKKLEDNRKRKLIFENTSKRRKIN